MCPSSSVKTTFSNLTSVKAECKQAKSRCGSLTAGGHVRRLAELEGGCAWLLAACLDLASFDVLTKFILKLHS